MRKVRFILIVVLLGVLVPSCTKVSNDTEKVIVEFNQPSALIMVEELGTAGTCQIFSLKKDSIEYIVVCGFKGDAAIIKHELNQ